MELQIQDIMGRLGIKIGKQDVDIEIFKLKIEMLEKKVIDLEAEKAKLKKQENEQLK